MPSSATSPTKSLPSAKGSPTKAIPRQQSSSQRESTPTTSATSSPQKSQTSENDLTSLLYSLPFSKIRSVMSSTPDTVKISEEGLFAMTKAAEGFIGMLAKGAYEHSNGSLLSYNNLAEFVHGSDNLAHVHEMVPKKVKFSTVQDRVLKRYSN